MLIQQTTTDNGSMHNLRIARTTENEMMQLERMVARRLKMHSWGIVGGGLGFFFFYLCSMILRVHEMNLAYWLLASSLIMIAITMGAAISHPVYNVYRPLQGQDCVAVQRICALSSDAESYCQSVIGHRQLRSVDLSIMKALHEGQACKAVHGVQGFVSPTINV